jgi:hypothetical protein
MPSFYIHGATIDLPLQIDPGMPHISCLAAVGRMLGNAAQKGIIIRIIQMTGIDIDAKKWRTRLRNRGP